MSPWTPHITDSGDLVRQVSEVIDDVPYAEAPGRVDD